MTFDIPRLLDKTRMVEFFENLESKEYAPNGTTMRLTLCVKRKHEISRVEIGSNERGEKWGFGTKFGVGRVVFPPLFGGCSENPKF